ncbi:MAG: HAMP domain-containing histidine kinase [Phycisphaerales bacterium]|nr:HAMP domain-containing histidine kinase [Phycisphaerales bacterium]
MRCDLNPAARTMSYDAKLSNDRDVLLGRIREMEGQISRLEADLDRTSRLATLGILAGMIAHEFNNLLTPVMSYSQLAIASPDDRELVAKALNRTVDGAQQLSRIASAILGFLRDDDQMAEADVNRVIDLTLECMAKDPQKAGISVVRRIPDGVRAGIRPICLQQVLLNLFLNAIEAMRGSGGELRVTGAVEPGGFVRLTVSDTGCGMTREMIEQAFRPLASRTRDAGGSAPPEAVARPGARRGHGLGLAICKRLIEEAGGSIQIDSQVGEGTTFAIRVPAARQGQSRRSA